MLRIVVRFIKTPGLVTDIIAFATNSLVDHVEFGMENHGVVGSWLGAHAGTGIAERAPDYCNPTREYRYGLTCTRAQYAGWLRWAQAQIGKHYNYADIVGLLFHDRAIGAGDKREICSQFVTLGLQAAGFEPLNCLPDCAYLITPETLHLSPIFIGRGI